MTCEIRLNKPPFTVEEVELVHESYGSLSVAEFLSQDYSVEQFLYKIKCRAVSIYEPAPKTKADWAEWRRKMDQAVATLRPEQMSGGVFYGMFSKIAEFRIED